ncbi:MAG: response regulator [Burkholderiaceae bacterium]
MMDKPLYRVAAAGLDPRDARLIEIVFRHSQYNRYAFQFVPVDSFDAVDILIVNTVEAEGLRALARMRSLGTEVPVVAAVPRGAPSSARHAISIDRLTLQLLPILNRVVELELADPDTRPMLVEPPGPRPVAGAAPVRAPMFAASMADGQGAESAPAQVGGTVAAPAATRPSAPVGARAPAANPLPPARAMRPAGGFGAAATAPASTQGPAGQAAPTPSTPAPPFSSRLPHRVGRFAAPADDLPRRRSETARTAPEPAPAAPARHAAAAGPARDAPVRQATAGLPPADLPAPGARIQVLVVDDSPTVRRQLTLAFERMGAACDAVPSAVAGLERMAAIRYDLVLVDVVMPEIDGYQLTREIRRRHRGIPVIILTSRSSPFDLARGALAGCSSYLVKPVTLRKLEAAVIKVLRKTLAIDDLSGLLRPISLYAPASSRPSEPEGSRGPAGRQ